ncbi:PucR family transcriptional regulator ligand-binding domain-containing protein [Lysinibacillus sp. MHQ-1]|nr:PucR family transcriptional regulator ligand-binding domain-containing protein [Lysinibacillus sp. MHQ-1]
MSQFQLKVLHVLENKYFQNAEVVAGHEGLLRIVKWAHVLEIVHVDNFFSWRRVGVNDGDQSSTWH